jgi:DNA-binding FrmR family transcriptional regulator
MEDRSKQAVLLRLRRIEGQVRGLQRMVGSGAPCEEILTQLAAAISAIKKAGLVMMQTYMEECLEKIQKRESAVKPKETVMELQRALSRYLDWN